MESFVCFYEPELSLGLFPPGQIYDTYSTIDDNLQLNVNIYNTDCMFFSCHVRVSE